MRKQETKQIETGFDTVELELETEYWTAFRNLIAKQGLMPHEVLSKPVNLLIREYVQASRH